MIAKKPLAEARAANCDPAVDCQNDDDNDNHSLDTLELTRRLKTASGESSLFQTDATNQTTLQQQETPLSIPLPVTRASPPKQHPIVAKESLSEVNESVHDPAMMASRMMKDDDEIDLVDALKLAQGLKRW